ncbi:MAG: hypothetical protein JO266_22510 [Acidobacteria bacterium]|nr:hypothetical protein [Acidobacteriota bacterium]
MLHKLVAAQRPQCFDTGAGRAVMALAQTCRTTLSGQRDIAIGHDLGYTAVARLVNALIIVAL